MSNPPATPSSHRIAYRLDEAAKLLGLSTISIRRAIKRGMIRPSRAFRTPLISKEELERFIAESSLPTATPKNGPRE